MPFRTELHTKITYGRNRWELTLPLVYETVSGETIVVPPGFVTDLASIPWLARTIVPHNRGERSPSVVHDFLFVIQDRELHDANTIMYEAMREEGVGLYARAMIRTGLMIGSWVPWRRNARALGGSGRDEFLRSYGLDPSRYQVGI